MTKRILLVTGYSGAGITSALHALADIGYETIDNIPVSLIGAALKDTGKEEQPIAFGIDTRTRGFDPEVIVSLLPEIKAQLLFMQADDVTLQSRFSATRRKHPLAMDRPVSDGIEAERSILYPLRDAAREVIDTTELSVHDLRSRIMKMYETDASKPMSIDVMSFGFKYGAPRNADFVQNVQFLRNPYWEENLRDKTGQDKDVQAYIDEDELLGHFIENMQSLYEPIIPRFKEMGKSYLSFALGCTGGHHRSVYVANEFGKWLGEQGYKATITHRDLDR